MVGGTVMAYLGGIHIWWPKITGRMYPEGWAKFSALVVFVGFNLTFFPQFLLGYLGMPRRYHFYPEEFQVLNVMSSAGASILGLGYVVPLIYLIWSMRYAAPAGPNPWGATGLEWQTSSPPPTHNFEEHTGGDGGGICLRRTERRISRVAEGNGALADQFDDLAQQHEAASLGMWVFLVTEIMFFGGLFTGYTVYRAAYPEAFRRGQSPS